MSTTPTNGAATNGVTIKAPNGAAADKAPQKPRSPRKDDASALRRAVEEALQSSLVLRKAKSAVAEAWIARETSKANGRKSSGARDEPTPLSAEEVTNLLEGRGRRGTSRRASGVSRYQK